MNTEEINPDNIDNVEQPGFGAFGLSDAVMQGVDAMGFTVPSPIQMQAIPLILAGKDLIGQAHTGTGKTAAFGLPGLHGLRHTGAVEILVITPTRELATQVCEEIHRLGKFADVKAVPVYGGQPYVRQIESIRRGAQIVVATPGRLLDLLKGGSVEAKMQPWMVVIDEADEMLDMGFLEDVQSILEYLPAERQTLLFSATMPKPIADLAGRFMREPELIRADLHEPTSGDIEQQYYVIDEHERDDATVRLIDSLEPTRAMIFCRTKGEVDRLAGTLAGRGVLAQPLHGDMEQPMRERVLKAFRAGEFQVLVATDVAARGLDIPEVTHVFNYHIPFDTDAYIHRIGRTGRAGRAGVAVTLVTPREYHGLRRIQSKVGQLQHNLIPTHREMQRTVELKLLESIRTQASDADTEHFVLALEEELGLAQAANKMAALLLERDSVSGPDHIGVKGERLEKFQRGPKPKGKGKPFKRDDKPYKKPGGGKRAYGHGKKHDDQPASPPDTWSMSEADVEAETGGYAKKSFKRDKPAFRKGDEDSPRPAFKKKFGDRPKPGYGKPYGKRASSDSDSGGGYGADRPARREGGYRKFDGDSPRPAFKKKFGDRPKPGYGKPYGKRSSSDSDSGGGYGADKPARREGGYRKFDGDSPRPAFKKKFGAGAKAGYGKPSFEKRPRPDREFGGDYGPDKRDRAQGGYRKHEDAAPRPGFKKKIVVNPDLVPRRRVSSDSERPARAEGARPESGYKKKYGDSAGSHRGKPDSRYEPEYKKGSAAKRGSAPWMPTKRKKY